MAWSCAWMFRTSMPNLVLLAQVDWAQRCQKAMGIQEFKKFLAFFKYLKIFFCSFRLASVLKPWGYVYIHTEVWFPPLASAFLVFFEKYQRFLKKNEICNIFWFFLCRFGKNRAQTLMLFFFSKCIWTFGINMEDFGHLAQKILFFAQKMKHSPFLKNRPRLWNAISPLLLDGFC